MLRAIDGYAGEPVTGEALRLLPLVFVRPRELRVAEWAEIDLDAGQWIVPSRRIKMGVDQIAPLSRQAVGILRELQPVTTGGFWYSRPCGRATGQYPTTC